MAQPAGVNVAYGSGALNATPTYTRIDSPATLSVTSWDIRRGRSYVLDKTGTGTATVGFTDLKGTLDPTNTGGPFYPMNPNCPMVIALYNPITATWHTRFTGLIQNVSQTLDTSEKFTTGTLTAADLFSLLAIAEIPPGVDFAAATDGSNSPNAVGNTTYAQQTVGDRIKTILADVGIPSALAAINTGNIQVQPTVEAPGTKVLAALFDCADAEFPGVANLFVDAKGIITFLGRLARFDPSSYSAHTWNCGDNAALVAHGSGWCQIAGMTFDRDVEKIVNAARFSPQGIADADIPGQLAASSTSIAAYGTRTLSGDDLLTAGHVDPGTTDALTETASYGVFYADETQGNYKDPRTRISQLVFRGLPPEAGQRATDVWNLLCNIEIGDGVNVTTTHPGGGGFSAEPYFVEGVTYQAAPFGRHDVPDMVDVTLTVDLSPQEYFTNDPFPTGT